MTILQAITMIDRLRPNQYSAAEKIGWLSRLDGKLYNEVILSHEGTRDSFSGYSEDTDTDTQLLVTAPYDEDIYIHYLEARIDQANGETAKYNQSISLYNNACLTWMQWYNRNNAPTGGRKFKW